MTAAARKYGGGGAIAHRRQAGGEGAFISQTGAGDGPGWSKTRGFAMAGAGGFFERMKASLITGGAVAALAAPAMAQDIRICPNPEDLSVEAAVAGVRASSIRAPEISASADLGKISVSTVDPVTGEPDENNLFASAAGEAERDWRFSVSFDSARIGTGEFENRAVCVYRALVSQKRGDYREVAALMHEIGSQAEAVEEIRMAARRAEPKIADFETMFAKIESSQRNMVSLLNYDALTDIKGEIKVLNTLLADSAYRGEFEPADRISLQANLAALEDRLNTVIGNAELARDAAGGETEYEIVGAQTGPLFPTERLMGYAEPILISFEVKGKHCRAAQSGAPAQPIWRTGPDGVQVCKAGVGVCAVACSE